MEEKKEVLLKYLINNHEYICDCGKKIDLKPIFKDVIKDVYVYLENNDEILFDDLSSEFESIFRTPSIEDVNSLINKEKVMFGENLEKHKEIIEKRIKNFNVALKRKKK